MIFKINYAISAVTTAMGLPVKRQGVLLICLCSSGGQSTRLVCGMGQCCGAEQTRRGKVAGIEGGQCYCGFETMVGGSRFESSV